LDWQLIIRCGTGQQSGASGNRSQGIPQIVTKNPDKLIAIEVGLCAVTRHRFCEGFIDGLIESSNAHEICVAAEFVQPQHRRAERTKFGHYLADGKSLVQPPVRV